MNKYLDWRKYVLFAQYHLSTKYKKSYSQCGEDLLMRCALNLIGIEHPTYIDIGTNHPILNNNTYLFYSTGSRGVCVEPDPELFRVIKRTRTRDVCLQAGVGPEESEGADFYAMSSKPLGTFSQKEAEKNASTKNYGDQSIQKVLKLPLYTVDSIVEKYLSGSVDIISVDAEGLDFEILKSINVTKYRPKLICAETLRYSDQGTVEKQKEILEYLASVGYMVYADTNVNTVFIDSAFADLIR
ncbi:FkbM family methyltransferase [bacterium]|nr:FkbM family methyltransferase [bacterium]